jgi:hypothetical protein
MKDSFKSTMLTKSGLPLVLFEKPELCPQTAAGLIFILSAKYGLIELDEKISIYH